MNHHVGQTTERNTALGYVNKVLQLKYSFPFPQNLVRVTHMLGHYASTRYILQLAGIPNILETELRVPPIRSSLKFADDAKLRFRTPPAGTHRMAVCYEAAKRLSKYQYAFFCPDIEQFTILPGIRKAVVSDPAKYHIGAEYLTGTKDATFNDTQFENFIGRLGTFIYIVATKSTLAHSPHFAVSRIESAPDYSVTWRNILNQIARARELVSFQQLTMEDITEAAKEASDSFSRIFSEETSVPN